MAGGETQDGTLDAVLDDLVLGNRILYRHEVVDAFGHISVRDPRDPSRYFLARSMAPGLVTRADLVLFDLDSNALEEPQRRYYLERFIHGEIYRARPDVQSVVHCHAPALIPFGVTKETLRPVFHVASFLGLGVSRYDIRDRSGMTDMLVRTAQRAREMAEALGDSPIVLMRGHGATIVGGSIREVVARSVYAAENAALQTTALSLGDPTYLSASEAKLCEQTTEVTVRRVWELWAREVSNPDFAPIR